MDSRAPGPSGLLGNLRGFADGLLGSAHDRLELLALELHEEKYRLIQIFIWISAIVFLAILAMIFVSFAIVVLLWDTARIAAICVLAGVYVAALVAVVMGFLRYLKTQPKPFAATLGELRGGPGMYPSGELKELAARKVLLRARIDVRRWECAAAAEELSRPIAMLDRGLEGWRRISPFLKLLGIPGGILLAKFLGRRSGSTGKRSKFGMILAALPMIVRGAKLAMNFRAAHAARSQARP